MKKRIVFLMMPAFCLALGACSGDHSNKGGVDSAKYHYKAPSNVDTSKTTTTTGDASTVDNSGSGGTQIDTAKSVKKDSVKK